MKRTLTIILTVVLVGTLVGPAAAAMDTTDDEEDVTDLGADHGLDTAEKISEFRSNGLVTTDADRIDMSISVAESKSDVGITGRMFPNDLRNNYLRLEYNEDAERTVRLLIPSEYWTPYPRERAKTVSGDAQVGLEPVRGGDYTEVVVRFTGKDDVVVPLQWDSSVSYRAVERVDNRLDNSLGITLRDDNSEWVYVNSSTVSEGPGLAVGEDASDITVQYDATPDSPEETWINAPKGETLSDGIYYYQRSEDGEAYIVSKTDDPPAIRYNVKSSLGDRIRGDIRELLTIPDSIKEILG